MALNDMRNLVATNLAAATSTPSNANPVREVTRRRDAGPDFAQVMAQRHTEQLASERDADAKAATSRDQDRQTARDADRNNKSAAQRSDDDSRHRGDTDAAGGSGNGNHSTATASASSAPPAPPKNSGSGAASDGSRSGKGDDGDDARNDTATTIGSSDQAGALAVNAAINPASAMAAAALAAANANGATSSVAAATDAEASAARTVSSAQRGARAAAGELAALDDHGGSVAADAKYSNAKRDARPDVAIDAQMTAADAPRAAAGARDRLLDDFEQRYARTLDAAAQVAGRGDGLHGAPSVSAAGASFGATLGAATAAPPTITVATPVMQPGFGDALGDRVVMLAHQRVASAEITVTPADLGPVTIGIEMHGQDASLNFTAAHPATRAAIEDALPRLRDMFANSGLNLAQTNVGGETRRDPGRSRRGTPGTGRDHATGIDAIGAAPAARATIAVGAPRLIDIRV